EVAAWLTSAVAREVIAAAIIGNVDTVLAAANVSTGPIGIADACSILTMILRAAIADHAGARIVRRYALAVYRLDVWGMAGRGAVTATVTIVAGLERPAFVGTVAAAVGIRLLRIRAAASGTRQHRAVGRVGAGPTDVRIVAAARVRALPGPSGIDAG